MRLRPPRRQSTAAPSHPPPTRPAVGLAFAAIVLAMLPGVLDQTILATALPTVARELGSLSDVSWVVTAYVVAAAATTPLWGKLGDRHGRKRLLEISLVVFVAASALCGAAQDITQLIVLRLVQGAAAGGLMTLAMATVGDLVAPRERGRYQGYIAATFAVATIVGPLIGGTLVDHASWRWVFFVNLPLGVVALAGLHLRLPAAPAQRPEHPLDVAGGALLAGATSAFLLTCIWGGSRYAWGSLEIAGLIAATVAALARAAAPRAARRRPDRPVRAAAHAGRRRGQRHAVSRHRRRSSRSRCSCRCSCRRRPARARPRPGCCSSRRCSASRSPRRCRGAASPAPGATSASRSPGWRS